MSATATRWLRVSARRPCPICARPDWCLIAPDGAAAICARTESPNRAGGAGWLHRLRDDDWRPDGRRILTIPLARPDGHDWAALTSRYQRTVDATALDRFAALLGVSLNALAQLSVGWAADAWHPDTDERGAWTWPMRDACGRVMGVRTRFLSGAKRAIRGSREGLFIPTASATGASVPPSMPDETAPLLIAEGLTDCAALLTLGFFAIGRPSCTGAVAATCEFARCLDAVVVADADSPGERGARELAMRLALFCPSVRIIAPPFGAKDIRAALNAGATRADILAAIEAAPPLRFEFKSTRRLSAPRVPLRAKRHG